LLVLGTKRNKNLHEITSSQGSEVFDIGLLDCKEHGRIYLQVHTALQDGRTIRHTESSFSALFFSELCYKLRNFVSNKIKAI
jgi:hypothetical protein